MKKTVTQEDLDLNPELVEQGIGVGDEIEIPGTSEEPAEEGEPGGDGPGPGAPPPPPPTKP